MIHWLRITMMQIQYNLTSSSFWHLPANTVNVNQGFKSSLEPDRTLGIWQKLINHTSIRSELNLYWPESGCEEDWSQEIHSWLASVINDLFNSPKANQNLQICLDLCTSCVICLGRLPADTQRMFIMVKHAAFHVLHRQCPIHTSTRL